MLQVTDIETDMLGVRPGQGVGHEDAAGWRSGIHPSAWR
jgi:hypothetical protein